MSMQIDVQDRSEYKAKMNSLLEIDPLRTVVLTIDMQRTYLDPEVASNPVSADDGERVLACTEGLLKFARSSGMPVVHVYTTRRAVELERGFHGSPYGRTGRQHGLSQNAQQAFVSPIRDRLVGSPQAEVPAPLLADSDLHVPGKKTMDGFLGTELEQILTRAFQADVVVLGGINTDTCVFSTAFSAANRGYKPIVISDCVASTRGKDHHWMALELMSRSFAWVLTSAEFERKVKLKD